MQLLMESAISLHTFQSVSLLLLLLSNVTSWILANIQCIKQLLISYKASKNIHFIVLYVLNFHQIQWETILYKDPFAAGYLYELRFHKYMCKHFNNPWCFISPTCESKLQQLLKSFKQDFYAYLWHMYPHTVAFTHYVLHTGDLFFTVEWALCMCFVI